MRERGRDLQARWSHCSSLPPPAAEPATHHLVDSLYSRLLGGRTRGENKEMGVKQTHLCIYIYMYKHTHTYITHCDGCVMVPRAGDGAVWDDLLV